MIKFLIVLGFIQLVSMGVVLIYLILFFIFDLIDKRKNKKTNIEILIEEDLNKDWSD